MEDVTKTRSSLSFYPPPTRLLLHWLRFISYHCSYRGNGYLLFILRDCGTHRSNGVAFEGAVKVMLLDGVMSMGARSL